MNQMTWDRVPIEFPYKSFFSGKPESVWYFNYRSVLFWIVWLQINCSTSWATRAFIS